jgi:transketolase
MTAQETATKNIEKIGNQLRILSIEATTRAGSGHPTSCCSAADLVAALFFGQMRFDPSIPRDLTNDRFVLSKGHAAPLLYAAWAETGHVSIEDIYTLRQNDSLFEGHPTPRLDFVDVATGSLGQGLSAGLGMAIGARMVGSSANIYVLMGDGETAEGSVWEAASLAGVRECSNLVAIVDVNRLGQSQATAFGEHLEIYRARFEAFGWHAVSIDGHDVNAILEAYHQVGHTGRKPLAIIAGTIKGKGIPEIEDKNGWHGKVLPRDMADAAISELRKNAESAIGKTEIPPPPPLDEIPPQKPRPEAPFDYPAEEKVATRKAFGNALLRIGTADERIVAIDGDTENSTFTSEFGQKFPDRFVECYIAEQNMVGVAAGLAVFGKIPFVSTFACFLERALDQIRMGAISRTNLKLVGTHCGVSIGEDGPSQMGVEDMAMMRAITGSVVLSSSDAVSTERILELMTKTHGIHYLRVARPATSLIYGEADTFAIGGENGGAKVLRSGERDRCLIVATGITVSEALKAHEKLRSRGVHATVIDAYSIKPLGAAVIRRAMPKASNRILTVEDHSVYGGLGDAVAGELSEFGARVRRLGIRSIPHSGKEAELLAEFKIDADAIAEAVQSWLKHDKDEQAAA